MRGDLEKCRCAVSNKAPYCVTVTDVTRTAILLLLPGKYFSIGTSVGATGGDMADARRDVPQKLSVSLLI